MNTTREQAYETIKRLVERFGEHVGEYKRGSYNEHQTRVDYINPFFKALGWDMDNEQGFAEAYREVIHEDKVKIGGATKAPDYAFTLFGQRKFFVDAKKPGINIKSDIAPAYQVRRYGWSAKVPISVVTDFEEFALYDCTKKPSPNDKSSVSRIKYITCDQYLEEFDFLWDVFAKENLPKGRFDKYVQSDTRKKGTTTVDEEFLRSIEQWRKYLATSIALRNKQLGVDELNFAVQKTIDRIIFLRMCEDRGVEQYGLLKKAAGKGDVYANLFELYRTADEKYNSGLFDFKEDRVTPGLVIDNKVLKTIIGELYYPKCEYEFSVMPADILGSVYERFLGKTIRLTAGHQAKIEEKPEVRKAGGVYYTPKYIVDYIVENTVGKVIEGKTPKEVAKVRICDPACGSGSFLIGAYQYLLDWHLKYYTSPPGPLSSDVPHPRPLSSRRGEQLPKALTPDGNLTTAEKKRILLNNIWGVDIDPQAVEVTRLNLLLKALEGETLASINQQMQLFHERVLPNLSHNIQCGNSLIGPDFYDDQLDLFGEQMKKINAFDWQAAFPEVFGKEALPDEALAESGFDVVIGNPPWGADFQEQMINYIRNKFNSARERSYDSYSIFTEQALNILSKGGNVGFIIPDTFLRKDDYYSFREHLLLNYSFYEIIEAGPLFTQVRDTWCCVIFIQNLRPIENTIIEHKKLNRFIVSVEERLEKFGKRIWDNETQIPQSVWFNNKKKIIAYKAIKVEQEIIKKIERNPELGELNNYHISRGEEGSKFNIKESEFGTFKMIIPADIKINCVSEGKAINEEGLTPSKLLSIYTHPKIWITRIQKMRWERRIVSAVDTRINSAGMKTLQTITSREDNLQDLYYLQGILSSNLINFYCINYLADDMNQTYLSKLPIVQISESNMKGLKKKNELIRLVNIIIRLHKEIELLSIPEDINLMQSRIAYCERKINEIVYQLYGLTEDEIRTIEDIQT